MRVKDAVGRFGEQLAARTLSETGLRILARNWRCDQGELDIVAQEGATIVFVEVKTRSTTAFGTPAEAVTPVKAARIHRLALRWLDEHRGAAGWAPIRFDVVSIVRRGGDGRGVDGRGADGPVVEHLRGAF